MRLATIQTYAGPRAALRHGESSVDLHATDATLPPSGPMLFATRSTR